jgi:hypothetical protein
MKNRFKYMLKGAILSALLMTYIISFGQPTVTLTATTPLTGLTPGQAVSFEVYVNVPSPNNLSNFVMLYNFDRDVLTINSINVDAGFAAFGAPLPTLNFTYAGGFNNTVTKIAWNKTALTTGMPCANRLLFTMNFTFNGGIASIPVAIFNPGVVASGSFLRTHLSTSTGVGAYVATTWLGSHSVNGSYSDITSVVAGGNWATGASWDLGHAPNGSNGNVIINSSSNPLVVAANVTWPRNVKINPAGKLTVNTGIAFSLGGDMSIDGDGSGTGSFADKGTTNIAGTSTVKRYMFGDWIPNNTLYSSHLVSSPVAAQSNVIFEGSLMNKWNEVAYNWDPMTVPFETMEVGKGYAVSPASPGITATFTGALNTGNITISGLTLTNNSGINSGFNLVGNPFASAIKWETGITMINLNSNAWVWNGGAYISYAMNGGDFIPAEQAFFVQATGNGSLMIPNSVRNHGGTFYKSGNPNWLTLRVEGNNYWDRTQLIINPLASVAYEREYDAIKLMGSPVAPQLYCILPDAKLSINSLPDLDESSIIKLGFKSGAEGDFTISVQDLETFTASNEFYLVDLLTNTTQNLKSNPVYTFNAAPGQLEHRFNLTFSTVGIGEVGSAKLNIYAVEKVVNVEIPAGVKGDIVVYNLLGSEIARKAVEANSLNKINLNVPSGYYLVKVDGVSYTANGKVFIK